MYWLVKHIAQLVFRLFMDVRIEGLEHVPKTGGAVVIGNHPSALDTHLLMYALRRRWYAYVKASTFERPFLAWYWRQLGGTSVQIGGDNSAAKQHGQWVLRSGHLLVVMPEGDISPPYRLRPFRGGFLKLAVTEHVPVVPMITVGSEWGIRDHVNPTRLRDFILRRAKIRIAFLPPLRLENPTLDRALFDRQLAEVEALVTQHVVDLRRREDIPCRVLARYHTSAELSAEVATELA